MDRPKTKATPRPTSTPGGLGDSLQRDTKHALSNGSATAVHSATVDSKLLRTTSLKSIASSTPVRRSTPPPIRTSATFPSSHLQKSPLKVVWREKSRSNIFNYSPETWKVSHSSTKPKRVTPPPDDYTPEKDPLSRKPSFSGDRDGLISPVRSLLEEKKKWEDPILESMRQQSESSVSSHLPDSEKQKSVQDLRSKFESSIQRSSPVPAPGKRSATQRLRPKRHTVIGVEHQMGENHAQKNRLEIPEASRNISLLADSAYGDSIETYCRPTVRSLMRKFESSPKLSSYNFSDSCFSSEQNNSAYRPEKGRIKSSSGRHSEENLMESNSMEQDTEELNKETTTEMPECAINCSHSSSVGVSLVTPSPVTNKTRDTMTDSDEETEIGFQRATNRRSVRELKKKFEANKDAENLSWKNSPNVKEKPSADAKVFPKMQYVLDDFKNSDHGSSSSTPIKTDHTERLIPSDMNISDVQVPLSPTNNSSQEGLHQDSALEDRVFSRGSRSRSSVKELRLAFEKCKHQPNHDVNKSEIPEVDGNSIVKPVKKSRKISSANVNPPLRSQKVQIMRQNFMEKSLHDEEQNIIERKKINIYESEDASSILSPKDMVKMIEIFEHSPVNVEEEVKPMPVVSKLDISQIKYQIESSDEKESINAVEKKTKVGKLDVQKLTPKTNSEMIKPQPKVSKLDINSFKEALSSHYSDDSTSFADKTKIEHSTSDIMQLVNKFANQTPSYMSGASHSEETTFDPERGENVEDEQADVIRVPTVPRVEVSVPGKVRVLKSSEMKFFDVNKSTEQDLMETFKNTKKRKDLLNPPSAIPPAMREDHKGFERKGSLIVPKNCRELNDEEKKQFFGRNAAEIFIKSTGVKRSTSDVSDLTSHRPSRHNEQDFCNRGKGLEDVIAGKRTLHQVFQDRYDDGDTSCLRGDETSGEENNASYEDEVSYEIYSSSDSEIDIHDRISKSSLIAISSPHKEDASQSFAPQYRQNQNELHATGPSSQINEMDKLFLQEDVHRVESISARVDSKAHIESIPKSSLLLMSVTSKKDPPNEKYGLEQNEIGYSKISFVNVRTENLCGPKEDSIQVEDPCGRDSTASGERPAESKATLNNDDNATKSEPAAAVTKTEPAVAATKPEPAAAVTKPEPAADATKPEPAAAAAIKPEPAAAAAAAIKSEPAAAAATKPEPAAAATKPEPAAAAIKPEPAAATKPEPAAAATKPEQAAAATKSEPAAAATKPEPAAAATKPEPAAAATKPEPAAAAIKPEQAGATKPEPAAETKPEPADATKPEPAAATKPEPAAAASKPEPASFKKYVSSQEDHVHQCSSSIDFDSNKSISGDSSFKSNGLRFSESPSNPTRHSASVLAQRLVENYIPDDLVPNNEVSIVRITSFVVWFAALLYLILYIEEYLDED
ncbi:protein MLP1 homolog [Hyalella azteca]|uniref:Protein MLP1 homolog n=1 Tax=Hyalella azteca TaxID=294128 RepID=A0A979FQE7_HYAAZ|nr:protein MLP1 homolog [Hyalella azteca]